MAHPAPSPSSLVPQAARQQLDELDALLKRMLALPVNRLADEALAGKLPLDEDGTAPPMVTALNPREAAPETTAWSDFLEDSFSSDAEPPDSWESVGVANDIAPNQLNAAESRSSRAFVQHEAPPVILGPTADPPVSSRVESAWAQSGVEHIAEAVTSAGLFETQVQTAAPTGGDVPPGGAVGWLWPVVTINESFDWLARRAGPPGRWLLSPSGRVSLALIGATMLLIAFAILSDLGAWLDLLSFSR